MAHMDLSDDEPMADVRLGQGNSTQYSASCDVGGLQLAVLILHPHRAVCWHPGLFARGAFSAEDLCLLVVAPTAML